MPHGTIPTRILSVGLAVLALGATGCEGVQTWVNPGGPIAGPINTPFWYMLGGRWQ